MAIAIYEFPYISILLNWKYKEIHAYINKLLEQWICEENYNLCKL